MNSNGNIKWDEDLSGPFVVFIINKSNSDVICITDLMAFIPVYYSNSQNNLMFSSHVDVLAKLTGKQDNIDRVSQIDFILNGIITYPYTTYRHIKQIDPATIHTVIGEAFSLKSKAYWIPKEVYQFNSINEAAKYIRHGIIDFVERTSNGYKKIAHFISGGEDSRVLSSILPKHIIRDAFIFLDDMNKEGNIAKKAAKAYGSNFNFAKRNKMHYLEILSPNVDLIGSGSQYVHVHSYGFHTELKLNKYSAVYGGLYADALLKGARIKKVRGSSRFPFIPDIKSRDNSANILKSDFIREELLSELTERRRAHLNYIKRFRYESADEWFHLWPSSMNMNIPNLHGNRRLFRSYEPFMSKEVVKTSATVPQKWKMNRRLFHITTKQFLKPTKWLFHGDGRLPYFSFKTNSFIQFIVWSVRKILRSLGFIKGNHGPWSEWNVVLSDPKWKDAVKRYSENASEVNKLFKNEIDVIQFYKYGNLNSG